MSVRMIVVYLIISKWINIFLAWLSRSNCHNRARWQCSGLHDPLEMSRERIVHSGRTNGSLALQGGWHLATETRKSGEDGLNGGQIRQTAVYNWKNNAQDFLFYIYIFLGETLAERQCLWNSFSVQTKIPAFVTPAALFCQFLSTVWFSRDSSSHVAYLPGAF